MTVHRIAVGAGDVSCRASHELALCVLRSPTSFAKTVFLAFHDPGVTGEHAGLFESRSQTRVEFDQTAGDSKTESVYLARGTAALKGGVDVIATLGVGELKGLHDPHPRCHGRKIVFEWAVIQLDLPGTVVETNTSYGLLAASGCLDEGLGHQTSTFRILSSRACGFWAA